MKVQRRAATVGLAIAATTAMMPGVSAHAATSDDEPSICKLYYAQLDNIAARVHMGGADGMAAFGAYWAVLGEAAHAGCHVDRPAPQPPGPGGDTVNVYIYGINNPGEEGTPEPYVIEKQYMRDGSHPGVHHPGCNVGESSSTPGLSCELKSGGTYEVMERDDGNGDDFLGTITPEMLTHPGTYHISDEDGSAIVDVQPRM